ncbi:TerB family tellurite resistance protein [Hyalangium rubrum]|uniref:TerB family tellurite resistance protein n=1 Tax=Hyalangium rubrum TaxID=3103134 RepID=A0ABU5H941_9BACT|nr:TerB family tellurite resistance protein [Hyalangium sp. s54d21]MDY7229287.1 TerB family tellurite resistance protein [Hyalangium sp. s54d21]
MTPSAEDRFNTEVIKLLLQVAWSDRSLTHAEHLVIFGLGRSWNVPELELQELLKTLKAGGALPEPDLAVLRTRPDDVLEAARALAVSDGRVADAEKELIARVQARLNDSQA